MDVTFIITILVAVLFIICLCIAAIHIRLYLSPLRNLPGPEVSNLLFGEIGRMKWEDGRILKVQKWRREKYGRIRKNHLPFGETRLDVSSVEWAKYILSTNAKNYKRGGFAGVSCLKLIVGHSSLLFTSGDVHKRLRKIANPAFKVSVLKTLLPVIAKCTGRLTDRWEKLCVANGGETTVLAKEFLSDLTLDVIGLAAFGFDFKASLEQSDCVASAFRLLTKGEVILVSTFPGFKYVTSMINFAKIVGPVSSSLVIQILYWVDQMGCFPVRVSTTVPFRVESPFV